MKAMLKGMTVIALLTVALGWSGVIFAEEEAELEVVLQPQKYVTVDGNAAKFRAHHWMGDGSSGGLSHLHYKKQLDDDTLIEFTGRALPDDNDIEALWRLDKEGKGYAEVEYNSFRKYFDNIGGVYYPFATFPFLRDQEDLELDIGHFRFDIGSDLDAANGFNIEYDRHMKTGTKSRLTWALVTEGATSRGIGPSWQDLDEVSDLFAINGRTQVAGFDVKGTQSVELVRISSLREEQSYQTGSGLSDEKIRQQLQEPETRILTTHLNAQKWFDNEKKFMSFGYRMQKVKATEQETLREYDKFLNPACYGGSCKNKFNADATNKVDSHTVVSQMMALPTKDLSLIAKFKAEVMDKEGASLYPNDTTNPPDGIANTSDYNESESEVTSFGQNFSVRYTGLPRTTTYAEVDLGQGRNYLSESLVNIAGTSAASTSSNFKRGTLTKSQTTAYTIGTRTIPSRKFNFNTQFRQRWETTDYDDQYETAPSSSARSAFFDVLKVNGVEASAKATWKPLDWLQNALRYQFIQDKYISRFDSASFDVEAQVLSQSYSYDVFLHMVENILVNLSYSFSDIKTTTAAGLSTSGTQVPGFNSGMHNALISLSYTPTDKVNYVSTFNFTHAGNFNDFTSSGLPLGADFDKYDVGLEMNWSPKEDLTISPRYAYYQYDANDLVDAGDYDAHVVWVDVGFNW